MTGQPDLDGVLMALRAAKVQLALAVLAIGRREAITAERYAINAQQLLTSAEVDVDGQRKVRNE